MAKSRKSVLSKYPGVAYSVKTTRIKENRDKQDGIDDSYLGLDSEYFRIGKFFILYHLILLCLNC